MAKGGQLLRIRDSHRLARIAGKHPLEEMAESARKKSPEQGRLDYLLVKAVMKRDKAGVIKALDEGAYIDHQGSSGLTPLMWACQNGPADMVELLLDRDADVNLRDLSNMTALDFALRAMDHEIVEILKAGGAKSGSELG